MKFSCVLVLALVMSACGGGDSGGGGIPTAPSANVPFSTIDLQVGTGTEATNGRVMTVNYTGWTWSASGTDNKGTQFDTSIGRAPFQFILGTGNVIQGWHRGVLGMRVGGRRRLIIPPDLAYGNNPPSSSIRANETLVFDVELLAVQ
jgi:FKBP-type peptidyl-prolyl cis-trans isomerase FkpA